MIRDSAIFCSAMSINSWARSSSFVPERAVSDMTFLEELETVGAPSGSHATKDPRQCWQTTLRPRYSTRTFSLRPQVGQSCTKYVTFGITVTPSTDEPERCRDRRIIVINAASKRQTESA